MYNPSTLYVRRAAQPLPETDAPWCRRCPRDPQVTMNKDDSADDKRAADMKAAGYIGATSEFLAPKPTFFNILYSHPNFGASALPALTLQRIAPPSGHISVSNVPVR